MLSLMPSVLGSILAGYSIFDGWLICSFQFEITSTQKDNFSVLMFKELAIIVVVAAVATGFSYVAGYKSRQELHWRLFWWMSAYSFAVQIVGFIFAEIFHTELFFDLTGGITYISITLIATISNHDPTWQQIAAACMVGIWALRLSLFLFIRILKRGEDSRFKQIKESKVKFFLVWFMQGLWVLFTMSPLLVLMTDDPLLSSQGSLLWLEIIGLVLWAIGLVTEVTADCQKYSWSSNPENKGRYINVGLWSVSRHPNYAGEIVVWIGAAIFAGSSLKDGQFISLISPVFVIILIWKVSGVSLLEEKADQRWGTEADYIAYKENTPVLFPYPRCKSNEPSLALV